MYEVGSWFIWIIDIAVLVFILFLAIVFVLYKRRKYQKDVVGYMRAEIQLATGWSEYFLVPCNDNNKSVTINNFIYFLNPERRRYGMHPMRPFLGMSWLQIPIRIESWEKDNAEPIKPDYSQKVATAAEIRAMTREIQATTAAMEIQEIEARQEELTNAISNQPNKMIVYLLLGLAVLVGVINIITTFQPTLGGG